MKIAIIGATPMAKIFAEKARSKGIETHCFAWEIGAVAKDSVDFFYPISIFEKDQILNLCRNIGIDGVIATTELTISVAAYISDELGLNTNSMLVSENITNKYWVRNKARSVNEIHQPDYRYITSNSSDGFEEMKFPIVVKPISEGGKRGVSIANNIEELKTAMKYAEAADRKSKGLLLEEYLAGGSEYSVESISFHGEHQIVQITQKISSGPPHFVELGHSQPADISEKMNAQICNAICGLLDAVMIKNGPAHTEIKIIDSKIFLIELNARPGGDHIAYPLTELSTGYDYIYSIIQVAMNVMPPVPPQLGGGGKYAGVRFVTQQTKNLLPLFKMCDNQNWLYCKHVEPNLNELTHNDGHHTNYFIYCSDKYPDFLEIE